MRRTGDAVDEIVTPRNIEDLRAYQRELGSLGRTNSRVQREIRLQSGQTRRQIERDVAAQDAALMTLENRLDRVSRMRATPTIDLDGITTALAQVELLHARMKALGAVRASPHVNMPTPAMGGGGSFGGFGAGSRGIGFGSQIPFGMPGMLAIGGGILAAAPPLIGSVGALGGSLGAATLGAGSIGAGAAGAGAIGGGALLAGILSSVPQIRAASEALSKYRDEVKESGADSEAARQQLRVYRQEIAGAPQGTRAFFRERTALTNEWRSAMRPSGANTVRMGRSGIGLARNLTPLIGRSSTAITGTAAGSVDDLAGFLNSSGSRDFYRQMTREAQQALPVMEQTTENILQTFMQISRAAAPFFHEANEWIETWTGGWADGTKNIQEQRREMQEWVDQLKSWGRLLGATFDLLVELGGAGAPAGQSMVDNLTAQLREWERWVQANPREVRAFFRDAVDSTEKLASALGQIVKMLWQIGEALGPLLDQFSGLVSFAGNAGLLSPGGLPLLLAAGAGIRSFGNRGRVGGGGGFGGGAGGAGAGAGLMPLALGGAGAAGGIAGAARGGYSTYGLARSFGYGRFAAAGAQAGALGGAALPGMKGAGGAALRRLWPLMAISGGLSALSFQGNALQKTQAGASSITLGAIPMPKTDQQKLDAAQQSVLSLTQGQAAGSLGIGGTRKMVETLRRGSMGGDLYIGTDASGDATAQAFGDDLIQKELRAWQRSLSQQVAGAQFNDILGASDIRGRNGQDPTANAKQVMEGIENQARRMRGNTGREFSQMGLDWAKAMARANPKLREQYETMASGIEKRLRSMGMNVRVIHGKIVDTSKEAWGKVQKEISTRTERARQEASKNLTALQAQALAILKQMGYNPQQIANIKEDLMAGGQREQVAMRDVRQGSTGAGMRPSTNDQNFVQGHAHGGRIARPKSGSLQDEVPVGPNTMAAGDELIVNRHTERRVNRVLGAFGTTLGHEVNREQRGHYKPEKRENAALGRRMNFPQNRATGGILRAGRLAERMGLHVGEGPGYGGVPSSGHASGSLHYSGLAYDISGDPSAMRAYFLAALRAFSGSINELFYDPMGYYIDGGNRVQGAIGDHSDHVHIGFFGSGARGSIRGMGGAPRGGGGGAMVDPINLKRPKSALGGIPGMASDAATELMAKGLEQKINARIGAGGAGMGGGGGRIGGPIPSHLRRWNRVFAEHNSANGDWGGETMPFNVAAQIAEWAGLPGVTFAQIGKGESNLRPGATGIDPGGTKGLGWLMVTTGYNDELIARKGGERMQRNPFVSAESSKEIYDSQGLGAWYGDQFVTDPNAHWQGGGGGGGGRRRRGNRALGGRVVPFGGWYAKGGHGVVSSPTLLGVGENGPEEVSIKPLRRHHRISDQPRQQAPVITVPVDLRGAVIGSKSEAKELGDTLGRAAARKIKEALDESSTVKEQDLVG